MAGIYFGQDDVLNQVLENCTNDRNAQRDFASRMYMPTHHLESGTSRALQKRTEFISWTPPAWLIVLMVISGLIFFSWLIWNCRRMSRESRQEEQKRVAQCRAAAITSTSPTTRVEDRNQPDEAAVRELASRILAEMSEAREPAEAPTNMSSHVREAASRHVLEMSAAREPKELRADRDRVELASLPPTHSLAAGRG